MLSTFRKFQRRTPSFRSLLVVVIFSAPVLAHAASDNTTADEFVKLRNEARSYEHGEGVPKDPIRAASLYCEGARYGDAEAQFSLGWMYANGRGVSRSDEMAAFFFKLAAEKGHEQAKKMLRFVGETVAPLPECMRYSEADTDFQEAFRTGSPEQQKVFGLVRKLAPEYGVSPRLVMAVIKA